MSNRTSDRTDLLDIGYGLQIGLRSPEVWQVCSKNGCFDLIETADFYRVFILLERAYSEVESTLNEYAARVGAKSHFPLWRLVGAGLMSQADQWASLALTWFPHLNTAEKAMLGEHLTTVSQSKWASQKSRQLADRYTKQLRTT